MRYGVIPRSLRERVGLVAGKVPLPVIDCLAPLVQARALMAAVQLGVIDAITDGAYEARELARRLGLDAETLDLLLRLLVSMRYLDAVGSGHYQVSRLGRRTLVAGAPLDMRAYVEANYVQWKLVENLEAVLRSGRGIDLHEMPFEAADWDTYERAMLGLARTAAGIIARMMPVPPGARRMLDLGGGHGFLGAAVCRRHPPLRSTVVDLAPALVAARRLAREAGIDDVVEHREGNLLTDDPEPRGADVVLLANIVHHFSPQQNVDVLRRARAAMNPSGTVAIWDFERPAPGARPDAIADGAALFFRLTSTSGVATAGTYEGWLREAGFRDVRSKRSVRAPSNVLCIGVA